MKITSLSKVSMNPEAADPIVPGAPLPAFVEPSKEGRVGATIRKALADAQLHPNEQHPVLHEALRVAHKTGTTGDALRRVQAIADCAVTGRGAYERYKESAPKAVELANRAAASLQLGTPPAAMKDLASKLVARCDAVEAYLKSTGTDRAARYQNLGGFVGVSGEDDPPHRPVNVGASQFPTDDIEVRVVLAEAVPPKPVVVARLGIRYVLRGPLDGSQKIILFLHGHSSHIEEVESVLARLPHDVTFIAFDLPSSGYSEAIDPEVIVRGTVSDAPCLEFMDRTLDAFVRALFRKHGVWKDGAASPSVKVDCVAGGSLGGNLGFRLAARGAPWWWGRIASWSTGAIWGPQPSELVLGVPRSRMSQVESSGSRADYFTQCFDERIPGQGGQLAGLPQPELWYHSTWPERANAIADCRRQRQEIYHPYFRRAHWRIAYEQLLTSLVGPSPSTVDRIIQLKEPRFLLLAGSEDNNVGSNIFDNIRAVAEKFGSHIQGTSFLLHDTGHSIHNERPQFLVDRLVQFLDGKLDG